MFDKSIGKAVVDGYKQSEIADYLGLSRTTVSKTMGEVTNTK
jgi:DNA-binding transcriptional regulator LsrR (DeoR family)